MTTDECTGDCENQCSGIQICPLMCEETSLADEMDFDDYMEFLKSGTIRDVCEE